MKRTFSPHRESQRGQNAKLRRLKGAETTERHKQTVIAPGMLRVQVRMLTEGTTWKPHVFNPTPGVQIHTHTHTNTHQPTLTHTHTHTHTETVTKALALKLAEKSFSSLCKMSMHVHGAVEYFYPYSILHHTTAPITPCDVLSLMTVSHTTPHHTTPHHSTNNTSWSTVTHSFRNVTSLQYHTTLFDRETYT